MYQVNSTLRTKLEQIVQNVLGMELALLVMIMVLFLLVYVVR